MKIKRCFMLLCSAGLFCCLGVILVYRGLVGSGQAKQKQTALVCAEGNACPKELIGIRLSVASPQDMASGQTTPRHAFPVEFEDIALSGTDRQRIVSDFEMFFSCASSFEKLKGREIQAGVFCPSILPLEDHDGILILDDRGKKSVQINKVFSDKYLQAIALMDAHSEAIQQVKEFVTLMNSPDLLSQPIQVLQDLCRFEHPPDVNEDYSPSDKEIRATIAEMQKRKYIGVSALYFDVGTSTRFRNVKVPQIMVFRGDKNQADPLDFGGYLLEFYNGKWRQGWLP